MLNVASNYLVASLEEVDGVIVDEYAPDAFVASMRAASLEVYRGDGSSDSPANGRRDDP